MIIHTKKGRVIYKCPCGKFVSKEVYFCDKCFAHYLSQLTLEESEYKARS